MFQEERGQRDAREERGWRGEGGEFVDLRQDTIFLFLSYLLSYLCSFFFGFCANFFCDIGVEIPGFFVGGGGSCFDSGFFSWSGGRGRFDIIGRG